MESTSLYVLLLKNNTRFLCLSHSDKTYHEILHNAESQYEMLQKYTPIEIETKIQINCFMEWNYHVKRYMKLYGIDYVRGGDYYKEQLTDQERLFIEREIQDKTLFVLYPAYRDDTDNQVTLNPLLSEDTVYNKIKSIHTNDTILSVTDELINDIIWLREYIKYPSVPDNSTTYSVNEKISSLFKLFKYINKHGKLFPIKEWHPECVIDHIDVICKCYIENNNYFRFSAFYVELVDDVISHVLYILHYCKNRMDEIFFDYHSSQLSKETNELEVSYWD